MDESKTCTFFVRFYIICKNKNPQSIDFQYIAESKKRYLAKLFIIDIHDCLWIKILEIKELRDFKVQMFINRIKKVAQNLYVLCFIIIFALKNKYIYDKIRIKPTKR